MSPIDFIPLWLVFVIVVALTLLCVESGYRLGSRCLVEGKNESAQSLNAMLGSALALLAFMLAFTFGIAAGRFDERRTAVLTEANVIGTTYLRADFLEEPGKGRVKKLLREYVALRISPYDSKSINDLVSNCENIQDQLWAEAASAGKIHPDSPVCALFISSLNEVIDMHTKRVILGMRTRVPLTVWACLLLVTALSMVGIGYSNGLSGRRSWLGTIVLVGSFAVVMLLVADLDRPREGLIVTSQRPLVDLSKKLGPP